MSKKSGVLNADLLNSAREWNFEKCLRLIDQEADVTAATQENTTVLHYLARFNPANFEHGQVDRIQFQNLIEKDEQRKNANKLKIRLLRRVIQLCITQGANVAAKNCDGVTPLHDAAFRGCPEGLNILLNCHAPIDETSKSGETALHFAARANRIDNARILVIAGANATIEGQDGICIDVAVTDEMKELLKPFVDVQLSQKKNQSSASSSQLVARHYADLPVTYKQLISKMGISEQEAKDNYKAVLHIIRQVTGTRIQLFKGWADMAIVRKDDPQKYYKFIERRAKGGFGSVYFAKRIKPSIISSDNHALLSDKKDQSSKSSHQTSVSAASSSSTSAPQILVGGHPINQVFAVKRLACKSSKDVKKALREVTILARLNHPNIVKFEEAFFWNNEFWLVQEYLTGGTLKTVVQTAPLDERQIAHIAHKIFKALAYVHARGLAHRDIKPSNIMLSTDGVVKLIDFGLCVDVSMGPIIHRAGTCWYMPPEMILAHEHSYPADIWSAAITILEMAEEVPPYADQGEARSLFLVASGKTPTFKEPARWSAEFREMVSKCLHFDPKKRAMAHVLVQDDFFKLKMCSTKNIIQILQKVFLTNAVLSITEQH